VTFYDKYKKQDQLRRRSKSKITTMAAFQKAQKSYIGISKNEEPKLNP
jgi:hypothetical protein